MEQNNAILKIQEQEDVLNTFNKNIIVSASAGSGKTSVMIRKIIKLITEKNVSVKDLLVLTYTNAAASEMKQKLIKEMSANNNEEILKQIDDVSQADISTFDSFCQKLVKKYFYVLNIDPGFNILQGSEQKEYLRKSFLKAVKNFKEKDSVKYFKLFDCYSTNRTDKNVYEIISKINDFATSILDYSSFKQKINLLFDGDNYNNKASSYLLNSYKKDCKYASSQLDKLFDVCQNLDLTKYCEYINSIKEGLDIVLNATDFCKLIDYINDFSFKRAPKKLDDDNGLMDKIKSKKAILDKIIEQLEDYNSSEDYKNSVDSCKILTNYFFELYEDFVNEYTILKSNKNMYDYNDVERLTIKLLQNKELCNTIKQKYKNIFVDEFQDANLVQECILNYLKNENNLFFVGDLKQAIYGFRQSNSKIFERIAKEFAVDNNSESFFLNCNFRTTAQILNFVNKIFDVIMTEKTASLDYKNKANLNPKAQFEKENFPCVELDIINKEKQEKQNMSGVYSIKNHILDEEQQEQNAQANFVAKKITELVEQDIYDINLKKYRKVEYKDIAVLFRTRTNQDDFVKAMANYNIPVVENSNTDLEETYDVSVLIDLIKIAINYKNDYALASVMISSLFDFSCDELLKIRNNSLKTYFYEAVEDYKLDDSIYTKIQNMQNVLKTFYKDITFKGINNALINILKTQNYEFKISQSLNSISRRKNINDFIESFNDSKYNFSATEYLNFLQNNTREQKVLSKISSNNVVTFTTMHSSKGLEWPIVIVPNLESVLTKAPNSGEIKLNEEYGAGIKYFDNKNRIKRNSVFYDAIDKINKDEDFSEKLRLLYVALTRPKNRLIMVGLTAGLNFEEFDNEREIRYTKTYLSLIVNSLNKEDIKKINSAEQSINLFNQKDFVCNVINYDDLLIGENLDKPILNYEDNVNDTNNLYNYINTNYFNNDATKIAQKNSVSGILAMQEEFASSNYVPKKLLLNEHLNGVKKNELGSLYHKILELYDFNSEISQNKVNEILKQISNQNLFSKQTIKMVNIPIVLKNLTLLKDLTKGYNTIKEHTFVMELGYNEVTNSNITDKVLVQGTCDLICVKDDGCMLVDYKYSSKSAQDLIKNYNTQLYLYSKAINYGLNKNVDKVYLLSLKDATLIECNVHK